MAVPKLRFKDSDGREFPEWELCKLGGLFKERSQRANGDEELLSVTIEQGVLRQNDLARRIVSSEDKSNYKAVYKGDIVYNSMRMWQGAEGVSNYNGIVSPAYTIVVPKENVSSKFFAYMFKTEKALYSFKKYSQGLTSDTWNLKYPLFSKVPSNIPSLPEQQKIADFLTAYDTMIDIQSQRVEAMKTRKKGLLQKIFSQEIRFKNDNGQNYPEWEKKTVGSLANNIVAGGTPSTKNPAFYAGEIPWISSSDLVEDKINYLNMTRFITQDAINRSATKLIPAQSVMIVCRVGVGKVAVNELPLCTSQDFMNLIVKEENSPVFIGYLLMNLMVKRKNSVQGTAIKGIPSAEIKKFKVLVPALPEQQKIADFLTTVDAQIDVEEKRLETMKTIKKGLLQQMFI